MLFLINKMDVKASSDNTKVGITKRGEEKYVWFVEREPVWEKLQSEMATKTNWSFMFENGSTLQARRGAYLFTGIEDGKEVFTLQCDQILAFGTLGTAKLCSR